MWELIERTEPLPRATPQEDEAFSELEQRRAIPRRAPSRSPDDDCICSDRNCPVHGDGA